MPSQVKDVIIEVLDFVKKPYEYFFGFSYEMEVSTKPKKKPLAMTHFGKLQLKGL